MKYTDIFNQELQIGDIVLYTTSGYGNAVHKKIGIIDGFKIQKSIHNDLRVKIKYGIEIRKEYDSDDPIWSMDVNKNSPFVGANNVVKLEKTFVKNWILENGFSQELFKEILEIVNK